MDRLPLSFIIEHPRRIVLTTLSTVLIVAAFRYVLGLSFRLLVPLTGKEHDILDATTAGVLAGMVAHVMLASARSRRVVVLREMSRIADLNHHVRNCLQVILGTELMKKDVNTAVVESCERITETIDRLFPMVGIERRHYTRQVVSATAS